MSTFRRGAALWAALFLLMLGVGIFAERAFVTNRGGSTVDVFDTTSPVGPGSLEATITVGAGPVDIASDEPDSVGPTKLFVANSGSNSISVLHPVHNTAYDTITGGPIFGAFATPSGILRISDPRSVASFQPTIVVVDQQVTPPSYGGAGTSTIRFINPVTHQVVDALRDASPTARFSDVVWTDNMRLWVADQGDGGVAVVRIPPTVTGPPFNMGNTLIYQGTAEFADFIRDTASPAGFMSSPRRLATDGSDYVVVADGGSTVVTILDANYAVSNQVGEPGAVLASIDLSTAPGVTLPAGTVCGDVEVVSPYAYVTTTNATGSDNLHRINILTQLYAGSIAVGTGLDPIAGLGATADGDTLFAGCGMLDEIYEIDITPPMTFTETGVFDFGGDLLPFGFSISDPNLNPPSVPVNGNGPAGPSPGPPLFLKTGGDRSDGSTCGLLGLEFLLFLLGLRFVRRRI